MGATPLETYIETVDPPFRDLVRAADAAVRASGADFDVDVKYRMLMYALNKDWRHWVIAISQMKKAVNVRFLWGVLLDDPAHLLRAGTSHLMTLDFASADEFDPALVTAYVKEAVEKYDYFKEHQKEL